MPTKGLTALDVALAVVVKRAEKIGGPTIDDLRELWESSTPQDQPQGGDGGPGGGRLCHADAQG